MSTTTFENAKVGDRVWCMGYGWGTVNRIDLGELLPLRVVFDQDGHTIRFYFSGKWLEHCLQILFWSEIKFTAPEQPKRKVTKTGYIGIWNDGNSNPLASTRVFPSVAHLRGSHPVVDSVGTVTYETEE